MKRLAIFLLAILTFAGCEENFNIYEVDTTPPSVPDGVQVLNGNNFTEISWYANRERDLAGYNVYVSDRYDGRYTLIGSTTAEFFSDNVVRNGQKYFYAVTAYDYNNNESELSYEYVYGIPRPDGFHKSIFDYARYPSSSGFDFSANAVLAYDNLGTDVFFGKKNGKFCLMVWEDTDIMDAGATRDIYDIGYAPSTGWSPAKSEELIVGHTYIIWTFNNHYAKMRVQSLTNDRIVFDWAYQLVEGEPSLRPGKTPQKDADRVLAKDSRK